MSTIHATCHRYWWHPVWFLPLLAFKMKVRFYYKKYKRDLIFKHDEKNKSGTQSLRMDQSSPHNFLSKQCLCRLTTSQGLQQRSEQTSLWIEMSTCGLRGEVLTEVQWPWKLILQQQTPQREPVIKMIECQLAAWL